MAKRTIIIWTISIVLFLVIGGVMVFDLKECPTCNLPKYLTDVSLAFYIIITAGLLLRIIKAYSKSVSLSYRIGLMGIFTNSPECEECKEKQKEVEEKVNELKDLIPGWKLALLSVPVIAVAVACNAAAAICTGVTGGSCLPAILGCIAATIALFGALLELAAESEEAVNKKNELEELREELEKHQKEKHG